jgi:hypothetical protein
MTRIACACAAYLEIKSVVIILRKVPPRNGNGLLDACHKNKTHSTTT